MICKKPFTRGALTFGCGQCVSCRINRRRLWASRLLLESYKHGDSAFITLTYDEEHLPNDLSLRPADVQAWLKRIRKAVEPLRLRFYLVGEYGEETQRPHYHVILFGFRTCLRSRTEHRLPVCCSQCSLVKTTWTFGGVDLGTVTTDSIQYVCGYILKKMTAKNDIRLNGRYPEFARMSLRHGIGAGAMSDLAFQMMLNDVALDEVARLDGDVPTYLKEGRKSVLLGRYLRKCLRKELGLPSDVSLERWSRQVVADMELMKKHCDETGEDFYKYRLDKMKQSYNNLVTKTKIHESRRSV